MATSQVVPLPPIAEQRRIVAKVDELMALCDRLEVANVDLRNRQDRLAAASHHHLNNGADAEAFRRHAHFCLKHLPHLTTQPAQIEGLRKTILNLAVRGRLIPQDSEDEPVSELLKRIVAENAKLQKAKSIRPQKSVPPTAAVGRVDPGSEVEQAGRPLLPLPRLLPEEEEGVTEEILFATLWQCCNGHSSNTHEAGRRTGRQVISRHEGGAEVAQQCQLETGCRCEVP